MRMRVLALGWLIGTAALAAPKVDSMLVRLHAHEDAGLLSAAEFATFSGCIERGDKRCIAAIAALQPSGNTIRGETVTIALSRALRTDPTAVLRLRRIADESLAQLCADNDIEPSRAQLAAFRRDATRALRQVRDPRLRTRRDACLRAVAASSG